MKFDIILAGVGGQGVLSISAIIASSAMKAGLQAKQSEVHGMAQRGGAVLAHLRLSDRPIASDIIPRSRADLIVSMEPLESLRHLSYLSAGGTLLSAMEPVENIPVYPDIRCIIAMVRSLPRACLIDAATLARRAGSARATNMVMVGAASRLLPIAPEAIEGHIREAFAMKGAGVVETNLAAFRAGRDAFAADGERASRSA